MEFFESFILILSSFYALVILTISAGMFRLPKSGSVSGSASDTDLPEVTVIVAARNEERDMPSCIRALEQLDYPSGKLNILLVDDRSEDSTPELIKAAADRNPHFRALHTADAPENGLQAKARGIAWGARHATGEWIFITDADGEVHPGWIRHMLSGTNEKTGMIGGMVAVKDVSPVAVVERCTWAYTLPFAFGMSGFGASFICVGPNMAIRRSLYEQAGGLENSDFEVAEDLAIFRMVFRKGYSIKSYVSPETKVDLNPVDSFRHLISQQRRWLRGGFEGSWEYWIGLVFVFGYHNILSLSLLAGLFISPAATLAAIMIKSGSDLLMLISEKVLLKEDRLLRYFPVMEMYVILTMLWLPLSLLFNSSINWMGKDYAVEYGES